MSLILQMILIHIFLREERKSLRSQPGLELGKAGPLKPPQPPPPCPWPQNPDKKCRPRPLISCEDLAARDLLA